MAVISCKMEPGTRRGPVLRRGGGLSYYETYVVVTNSIGDDGRVVLGWPGLPRFGMGYAQDSIAVCTELDAQQDSQHDRVWHVHVRYERIARQGPPQKPEDITPENYPPRRSFSSIPYDTYPLTDLDGNAFKNSAGDWIEGVVKIKHNRFLTIEDYLLDHNESTAWQFQDAINSEALVVFDKEYPIHSAKLNHYDADEQHFPEGGSYWIRIVVIEFNPDLWHPHKELDKGPRFRSEIGYGAEDARPLLSALDDGDVAHGGDILLDGLGGKLDKNIKVPHLLEFKQYHELPFGRLMLPLKSRVES